MPVPPTTPSRPASITAAQVLIGLQLAYLCCCGLAPVAVWWPAFLAVLVSLTASATGEPLALLIMLPLLVGVFGYVFITVARLGTGDRRARFAVAAGLAAAVAFAAVPTAAMARDGAPAWYTLATAVPSLVSQAIAWACVRSTSAERWFRECEPYLVAPEP